MRVKLGDRVKTNNSDGYFEVVWVKTESFCLRIPTGWSCSYSDIKMYGLDLSGIKRLDGIYFYNHKSIKNIIKLEDFP